jgi:carboxyl-terminal processing protease
MRGLMRGFLAGASLLASVAAYSTPSDTTQFKPKAVYGKEAKVISFLLDNNHYRKIKLNDSLSSVVFDRYFKSLDNNNRISLRQTWSSSKSSVISWMI